MLEFSRRKLKLKVRPRLPADVVGGVGISVDKTPLRRVVNLDFSKLGEVWDSTGMRTVVWNPVTDEYFTAHPDGGGEEPAVYGSVSVDNIGLLRLITPPAVGQVIHVLNHSTSGDNGGGVFVTLDESPGTDDNGVYIDSDTPGTYYKRLIFDRIRAEWWGAKGDGTTVDNSAINAGLQLSSDTGIPLILYPRTYLIDAPYLKTQFGANRYYGLHLLSGMILVGAPNYTIIKIKNNISSNTTPKDVNVFVCDDAQSDISIYGVEFDLNGQNNLINGGFQCGGAIDITGNSAYVERLYIEKCTFRNGAGTNVIVLGQQTTSGPLGADVRIIDCRFIDNGRDTSDFTAVYAWGERVRVEGCLFVQSDTLPRTGKNWVAMELHGSENYFVRSKVLNYARACWCAPNYTRDARGQYVLDNVFDVWAYGPSLFSDRSTTGAVTDVFIERNVIILRADEPSIEKYGVSVVTNYGVSDVFIRHNIIIADGTGYNSKGCIISASGVDGQITRNVFFEHNVIKFAVAGLYARVNDGDGVLDEIHDRFNTYEDIGGSNGDVTAYGSLFAQAGTSEILKVSSYGNRYIGSSGFDNGVAVVGTVADAHFDENIFDGVTSSLNFGSATITRPRGKQAMAASYATADRPTYLSAQDRGLDIYDSTLGKVIRWSGSGWLT